MVEAGVVVVVFVDVVVVEVVEVVEVDVDWVACSNKRLFFFIQSLIITSFLLST